MEPLYYGLRLGLNEALERGRIALGHLGLRHEWRGEGRRVFNDACFLLTNDRDLFLFHGHGLFGDGHFSVWGCGRDWVMDIDKLYG